MGEVLNHKIAVPNLKAAVVNPTVAVGDCIGCKSDAKADPHRYNSPAAAPTAAWFSDLKHQGGRLLHAVALLLPFAPTLAGRMVRPSGLPVSLGPGR